MIENTTKLNENHVSFVTKEKLRSSKLKIYRALLFVAAAVLCIMGVICIHSVGGILYLLVALICFLLALAGLFAITKTRIMKQIDTTETRFYLLTDEFIVACIAGSNIDNREEFPYDMVDKAIICDDTIYIHLKMKDQYLAMDFKGFPEGDETSAIEFLESKNIPIEFGAL